MNPSYDPIPEGAMISERVEVTKWLGTDGHSNLSVTVNGESVWTEVVGMLAAAQQIVAYESMSEDG